VSAPVAARYALGADGSTVTWRREGAAPELESAPTLWRRNPLGSYELEGTMTRIAQGWRFAASTPPVVDDWLTRRVEAPVRQDRGSGLSRNEFTAVRNDRLFAGRFD
jgi:hypothetical protein